MDLFLPVYLFKRAKCLGSPQYLLICMIVQFVVLSYYSGEITEAMANRALRSQIGNIEKRLGNGPRTMLPNN